MTEPASTLHVSRSASRALTLLDRVVTDGAMTLGEAAASAELPASTALRHLRALADAGYLTRDETGQYSVGPTFLRLALAAFRSGPYARLSAAAQPHLEALAAATQESSYLAVRDGSEAVYIATVESPRAIRHVGWVGRSVPLDGTAVGAALLATPLTPGEPPRAHFNTGAIESDVSAITTAIHGTTGIVAALSILGPADRLAGEQLDVATGAITDAAVAIARDVAAPADA